MTRKLACPVLCLVCIFFFTATAFALTSFTDVTDVSGAADRGRGKGVAFADIDGDGDYDLYISNKGGANTLFRNDSTPGNIKFTDITDQAGDNLGDTGYSMGSVFGDVDNDGRPDLYIVKGGRFEIESNRLLHNESTPDRVYFRDITEETGTGSKEFTYGATFADIDNDGDLDLYLANYGVGARNQLYRNDSRDGKIVFSDITETSGTGDRSWSWSASAADVNGDGFVDLYVVNGRYPAGEPNKLYLNNQDGTFRDVSGESGLDDDNWGLGATFADINNDGDLDCFLSNYVGPNKMFVNDGKGHFTDVSLKMGLAHEGWGKGPTFGDVDHDGDLDLYEGDCKLANQLYINEGDKFVDVAGDIPVLKNEAVRTKGTVFSDIDGDGDLDLYVVNWNVPNRVYMNGQNNSDWLKVRLTGTSSNRYAIGSKVTVFPAGQAGNRDKMVAFREMTASTGFCAQPPQEVHFGLDHNGSYDVEIIFPSGIREVIRDVSTGQTLQVVEPDNKKVAGQ